MEINVLSARLTSERTSHILGCCGATIKQSRWEIVSNKDAAPLDGRSG